PDLIPSIGFRAIDYGLVLGGWMGQVANTLSAPGGTTIDDKAGLDLLFSAELAALVRMQTELWFTGLPGTAMGVGAALASDPEPRLAVCFGVTPWGTHIFAVQSGIDVIDDRQVSIDHWFVAVTD